MINNISEQARTCVWFGMLALVRAFSTSPSWIHIIEIMYLSVCIFIVLFTSAETTSLALLIVSEKQEGTDSKEWYRNSHNPELVACNFIWFTENLKSIRTSELHQILLLYYKLFDSSLHCYVTTLLICQILLKFFYTKQSRFLTSLCVSIFYEAFWDNINFNHII